MNIIYQWTGWRCYGCGQDSEPVMLPKGKEPVLPHGWQWSTVTDCGLTGYTDRRLYCAECIAKRGTDDRHLHLVQTTDTTSNGL